MNSIISNRLPHALGWPILRLIEGRDKMVAIKHENKVQIANSMARKAGHQWKPQNWERARKLDNEQLSTMIGNYRRNIGTYDSPMK